MTLAEHAGEEPTAAPGSAPVCNVWNQLIELNKLKINTCSLVGHTATTHFLRGCDQASVHATGAPRSGERPHGGNYNYCRTCYDRNRDLRNVQPENILPSSLHEELILILKKNKEKNCLSIRTACECTCLEQLSLSHVGHLCDSPSLDEQLPHLLPIVGLPHTCLRKYSPLQNGIT